MIPQLVRILCRIPGLGRPTLHLPLECRSRTGSTNYDDSIHSRMTGAHRPCSSCPNTLPGEDMSKSLFSCFDASNSPCSVHLGWRFWSLTACAHYRNNCCKSNTIWSSCPVVFLCASSSCLVGEHPGLLAVALPPPPFCFPLLLPHSQFIRWVWGRRYRAAFLLRLIIRFYRGAERAQERPMSRCVIAPAATIRCSTHGGGCRVICGYCRDGTAGRIYIEVIQLKHWHAQECHRPKCPKSAASSARFVPNPSSGPSVWL